MSHKHKALGAAIALAALGGVGAAVVYSGVYDVGALDQHWAPTHWLLDTGMRRSVERRAARIEVPPLDDERLVARGLAHFREHCVVCHGAPGVAPAPLALGLTPVPGNLVHAARHWRPAELYWIVRHGIKMAGMPAWQYRLGDDDLWAIVAFMRRLPQLSPAAYRALPAATVPPLAAQPPPASTQPPASNQPLAATPAASADRGRVAIRQYACTTCHRIPGIVGPSAPVGPTLDGIARRSTLAGLLPNTPQNMARWLREPQRVNPDGAMPDLGVSERDARDIAAYLATLD